MTDQMTGSANVSTDAAGRLIRRFRHCPASDYVHSSVRRPAMTEPRTPRFTPPHLSVRQWGLSITGVVGVSGGDGEGRRERDMSASRQDRNSHLDEEIAELRSILSLVRRSTPVIALVCVELARRLRNQAARDDDDAAVDEALGLTDRALHLLPADDPNRCVALIERALTLEQRFHRCRHQVDLDAAIIIWRQLANADQSAAGPLVGESTARLGSLLRQRVSVLVDTADDDTIAAALVEAQRTLLAARNCLPEDSPSLAETCWLLGLCWGDRYEQERDPRYLDRAIAEIGESLRLAPDPWGDRHYALAKALHERARRRREARREGGDDQIEADLAAALQHIRVALSTVEPTDPFRIEVLWAGVTVAITQMDVAPTSVDVCEVRAWVDDLLTVRAAADGPGDWPAPADGPQPDTLGVRRERPGRTSPNSRW